MKSKNVLNKVVNVCGKDMGERQEQFSQVYEHCVVGWNSRGVWLGQTPPLLPICKAFVHVNYFTTESKSHHHIPAFACLSFS